jgi:antitoxin (DNA-binding transcriptional repressor) of toxin-antitoxin stability system
MKKIGLEKANLETCVSQARRERRVITRKGKPAALLVSVEGMDMEQVQLGSSDKFWKLITKRRRQSTISRTKLEQGLDGAK